MKKILLIITLLVFSLASFSINTYADKVTKVKITEYIPWACKNFKDWKIPECSIEKPCDCEIEAWFKSITSMLWNVIRYFTIIAALAWVLMIVIFGIQYSMWWMDTWVKESAKKNISMTVFWLVILLLSWVILNAIAPWIYK